MRVLVLGGYGAVGARIVGHGTRRLVRADYADQHVLTRDLGVPVHTYFGLDSRLATGRWPLSPGCQAAPEHPVACPCPAATGGSSSPAAKTA